MHPAADLPPEAERRSYFEAAREAVAAASALVRTRVAEGFRAWRKADRSFVTEVDLAVEGMLRDRLGRRFPDHDFLGEELDRLDRGSDFRWIIDPIDGTFSFTHRIPLYGIVLGLHFRGQPLVGIIDHPALGLTLSAGLGLGAFRNGEPLRLRDIPLPEPVEDDPLAVCDRAQFVQVGRPARFDALMQGHPRVRTYPDCFGHSLAIQGAVGAMVDVGLRLWDLAATPLLVEEAGGRFLSRAELAPDGSGQWHHVLFGKPRVVDWLAGRFDPLGG